MRDGLNLTARRPLAVDPNGKSQQDTNPAVIKESAQDESIDANAEPRTAQRRICETILRVAQVTLAQTVSSLRVASP